LNSNSRDRDFKLNKVWNLAIRFSCTLSQIKEHGGEKRETIIIIIIVHHTKEP
jgi:hypothetical protein